MEKKAIKIKIEMLYLVDEDKANTVFENDLGFFKTIEDSFYEWEKNENDPRTPIDFILQHGIGTYEEEEK